MSAACRKQAVEPSSEELSITRQCELLSMSRSSYYYRPKPVSDHDLELMRLIDEQYLKQPTWGSRSMRNFLRGLGYKINRKKVRRLMRIMGICAVYPKPRTSLPHPGHKVYPYLLKGVRIERANQVWSSDITYIPMRKGFMYLCAVIDWHSRKVLSWRLSNTMEADFCVDAAAEAIDRYGPPEIFNTDQGVQFTSADFTGLLKGHGIRISMDGKGRCLDNIFVERLWWTLKYHYVYLRDFEDGVQLRKGLAGWFDFYNRERPHQSLNGKTPNEAYFNVSGPISWVREPMKPVRSMEQRGVTACSPCAAKLPKCLSLSRASSLRSCKHP